MAVTTDSIKWMVTVSARLRWWYKLPSGGGGHQVKGAVSFEATTNGFFCLSYDGDLVDSTTMAFIKPLKGSLMLPSHDSGWKLEHKKIKSSNAKGRAIVLSFDHQDPYGLDRIQVSFPIIVGSVDGTVDDGKLFIQAIQKALEERRVNRGLLVP